MRERDHMYQLLWLTAALQNIYKTANPQNGPCEVSFVDMQDSNPSACLAAWYQLLSNKYHEKQLKTTHHFIFSNQALPGRLSHHPL